MKMYEGISQKTRVYVKIIIAMILLLVAVAMTTYGVLWPKHTWKSGTTIVTLSQDGTMLTVKPIHGITHSFNSSEREWMWVKNIPKIRGRGAMKDYSYSDPPWKRFLSTITELVIEDGVTYIGEEAFSEHIESRAFFTKLPEERLSERDSLHADSYGLKSVTIPSSVTEIGLGAFSHLTNLTSVTITDGVLTIEGHAFSGCDGLESITIPQSVKYIGALAFPCGLSSISILNPTPPKAIIGICESPILYVPESSVDIYKKTKGWSRFTHIKPINGIGSSDVDSINDSNSCSILSCGWNCWYNELGECKCDYSDFPASSRWIGGTVIILIVLGFSFWIYVILASILKKIGRTEEGKVNIQLMILTPIFTWLLGMALCFMLCDEYNRQWIYDWSGAIIFGGIYLVVTMPFYLLLKKRIASSAISVILIACHIFIFAYIVIGGGL